MKPDHLHPVLRPDQCQCAACTGNFYILTDPEVEYIYDPIPKTYTWICPQCGHSNKEVNFNGTR